MDEEYPRVKFRDCRAHNFQQPILRTRGSLTSVINAALILGAKEIRLLGIELDKLQDFYFDVDKWAKDDVERKLINDKLERHRIGIAKKVDSRPYMYDKYDPTKVHTTSMPYKDKKRWGDRELRGMIDLLWWMDKELREEGHRGIYTTVEYEGNRLEYKSIMEE